METKNGFDVVFTISETPIFSEEVPSVEPVAEELPPQAERLRAPRVRTAPMARERVTVCRGVLELNIESPGLRALSVPDNDVIAHVINVTG
jgi:hypothetical protein